MSLKPLLSDGGFGISNSSSNTSTTVIYANTDIATANIVATGNGTFGNVLVGNSTYSTSNSVIQGWSYSGVSKSISAEDATSSGLFFKTDGTVMYLLGYTSDKVYQYSLSSAWNVSTATVSGNVSLLTQDTSMQDLYISSDGANLYTIGQTADAVFQYTMATPWDVTTATYSGKTVSIAGQELTSTGLYFSNDLANMYIVGSTSDTVFQYTLSTPGDVSTATYASKSFSIATQEGSVGSLAFNSDGTKMFIVGSSQYNVNQYVLGTAWDVSTASYVTGSAYYIGWQEAGPTGLYFNLSQEKFWVSGTSSDTVFQYNTGNSAIVTANSVGVVGQLNVSSNAFVAQNFDVTGTARVGSTLTVSSTTTLSAAVTMSSTTSTIAIGTSQTTGTITLGSTAQTGAITVGQSVTNQTLNLGTGATSNANVKIVNIGTGSTGATSNTNINIGSAAAPANVTVNANTTFYIANTGGSALSVVGNASVGNLTTSGIVTATGNITGGNIITAGVMSSTGNATHGNIITSGLITATGNITGGNIITAGIMSSTGNVTAGNLVTTGIVSAGTLSVSGTSNLGNVGNVKITGGTDGQFLKTDGAGNLSWATGGGGTGTFTVYTRTGSVIIDVIMGYLPIYGRSGTINIVVT